MVVGIGPNNTYPEIIPTVTPGTLTIGSVTVDTDGDGINDGWEISHFNNLTTASAISDFDKDGYTDKQEFLNGGIYNPKVINESGGIGYINISVDSLIVNFPQYGLYTYNSNSLWTIINAGESNITVTADIDSDGTDEIISFFEGYGLYVWDNGTWEGPINRAQPEAMIKFGNRIAIDFGSPYGLYTYSTAEGFSVINGGDPTIMAEADFDSDGVMELAVHFSGYGIYIWDNGAWGSRLNPAQPEAMIKFGNRIAMDFGSAYGLYTYSAAEGFSHINGGNPTIITEIDVDSDGVMELAAHFTGHGIYIWDNGAWGSRLNPAQPEAMIKFGNRIAMDFGSAYGLYTYSAAEGFSVINGGDATIITEVDVDSDGVMELAAHFTGYGIYIWDNGAWGHQINPAVSDMITSGNMVK